jgi:hypothetical protein
LNAKSKTVEFGFRAYYCKLTFSVLEKLEKIGGNYEKIEFALDPFFDGIDFYRV